MTKILIAALMLLATPLATADGIDILSPSEGSCDDTSDYWSESRDFDTNGSRQSWSYGGDRQAYGCDWSSDTLDGGVTANGNEVVDARVGSDSEDEHTSESTWSYGSSEWWGPGYYRSSYGYNEGRSRSETRESGSEIHVSTLLVDARQHDGCAYNSDSYAQQEYWSSYSSRDNWTSSSDHAFRFNNDSSSSACDSTVGMTSGVTSARAGREDVCASDRSSYEHTDRWWDNDGSSTSSYAGNTSQERCHDGYFASAGSERADVGSRSECEAQDSQASQGGNETTYSQSSQSCTTRTGVFGPTGLGIYLEDGSSSYGSCANDECWSEGSETHALVVEQAYVPRLVKYLP